MSCKAGCCSHDIGPDGKRYRIKDQGDPMHTHVITAWATIRLASLIFPLLILVVLVLPFSAQTETNCSKPDQPATVERILEIFPDGPLEKPSISKVSSMAPDSAQGTISGRVMTSSMRPIGKVTVVLSGGSVFNEPRATITNWWGYYSFDDLPVGEVYIVSIGSARVFTFAKPTHVINFVEDLPDLDFIAN